MKLKATAAVLSAAALFAACSDEVVNVNDEAKEKATFSFKIVDGYTGEAIQGASVYSVLDDETEEANELGIVTWKKNVIGNYAYYVSAEGYKTIQVQTSATEVGQGNVARVPDVFNEVRMVPGGLTVKGVVLYTDKKDVRKGAADVTVHASCDAGVGFSFVPSEVSVKTDKTGEYEFTDLPSGVDCYFEVGQEEVDGDLYEGVRAVTLDGARGAKTASVASISLQKVTSNIELISDNLNKVDTTTDLKLVFSAKIAKDSLPDNVFVLTGGDYVLANVSVGEDGKTLIIKPFSKKWEKDGYYKITGRVWSIDGASFNLGGADLEFEVGAASTAKAPDQVSDLKVEEDGLYLNLTWTAPKNGYDGVYVFYKTDKMADWLELDYYTGKGVGSSLNPVDVYVGGFTGAKSVEFMVLPFNGTISDYKMADKSKAKTVKYTFPAEE